MLPARTTAAPWLRETRGGLFSTPRVRIGRFRRHPSEPDFAGAGPIDAPAIVFPRLAVRIAQAGKRAIVADATQVVLYDAGQEYSRAAVSPDGDRCDWFSFEPADVAEALRPVGTRSAPERFAQPSVPAPAPLVLRARALFLAAQAETEVVDPLAIEEEALLLLHAALAPLRAPRGTPASAPPAAWLALAESAQALVARRFATRVTLGGLAAALGCSPFHLCRAFRAATGGTVHRHLTALRLAAALEQLPERRRDLAALALELGFAHHAHFTEVFRREYGTTPSQWALQAGAAARARIR